MVVNNASRTMVLNNAERVKQKGDETISNNTVKQRKSSRK